MPERIQIGRLPIDAVTFTGALDEIERLVQAGAGGTVFTPNVDHIVIAEDDDRFARAYSRVDLSLCDGTPVLWASRLMGRRLPEKVSGSDLVIPLVERASAKGWRVFFLGGMPGIAERAAAELQKRYPGFVVSGTEAPRVDLKADRETRLEIARRVAATRPHIVLVAFGAPKQEIFSDDTRDLLSPAVLVCVGAGIDFVAGAAKRAPRWMSRVGLEWMYRVAHEPRRLAGRYFIRDPRFAGILLRQMLGKKSPRPGSPIG
jgi:N-acetylglucosaminyldiphosphoundecaprenol N-acetyl-beta-D-mannosaminyltransferase